MSNNVPAEVDRNMIVAKTLNVPDLRFYDARKAPFRIYGLWEPENEAYFKRLPDDIAEATSPGVVTLYRQTAGGRVRFSTDSKYVAIKTVQPYIKHMDHMPISGSSGFDLYIDTEVDSTYSHTFRVPTTATDGYESIAWFPDRRMRHFTINFPSYCAVTALYVGLQEDAQLSEGLEYRPLAPIYYYGSSITQGGCASRPGLAYQNVISRRLNVDFVNLGFSGNGRGEPVICRWMAEQEMSVFVSDYDHNAPNPEHLQNTHYPLYAAIREKHPDIPYIMISKPDFFCGTPEDSVARRNIVYESYLRAWSEGDRNVYFVDGASIFRGPYEDSCTVDRCHPNDLGFMLMADHIGRVIGNVLK